eukprot:GHRQ01022824.1.p3 GENE.GHRQ01022824.1~~GHRQ01022824.1.p3  ORF type:complete len:184 (-),score=37.49 GHRQ01022824.1:550-1101(-)
MSCRSELCRFAEMLDMCKWTAGCADNAVLSYHAVCCHHQHAVLLASPGGAHLPFPACSAVCILPPGRYVAFSGAGRTLGASSGASSSQAAAASSAPPGEWEGVDESQPTTSVQLRLSDGSRMVARMNHTHTVADIRRFIRASRPDMAGGYTLATGFPPAPISDESQSLEEAGLLNAVINQRNN